MKILWIYFCATYLCKEVGFHTNKSVHNFKYWHTRFLPDKRYGPCINSKYCTALHSPLASVWPWTSTGGWFHVCMSRETCRYSSPMKHFPFVWRDTKDQIFSCFFSFVDFILSLFNILFILLPYYASHRPVEARKSRIESTCFFDIKLSFLIIISQATRVHLK